jgi:hypothetical protein
MGDIGEPKRIIDIPEPVQMPDTVPEQEPQRVPEPEPVG